MTTRRRLVSVLLATMIACSLFVAAPVKAFAADRTVVIEQGHAIVWIQGIIQDAINASSPGDTVTVTGQRIAVGEPITLVIKEGVTVIWNAIYVCAAGPLSQGMLQLAGAGTFDIRQGSINVASKNPYAIAAGGTVTVRISGGYAVSDGPGTVAIFGNAKLEVTSGYISNVNSEGHAVMTSPALGISGSPAAGTNITATGSPSVVISGGEVRSEGTDPTICDSSKTISTSVTVSAGNVHNRASGHAIALEGEGSTVIVSGGNVVSENKNAILVNGLNSSVTVSSGTVRNGSYSETPVIEARRITVTGGWIEAVGGGIAIKAIGRDSVVTISGGVVAAKTGFAILKDDQGGGVTISGGFVFAWGNSIGGTNNNVILMFVGEATVSGSGIVCAWATPAFPPSYVQGSSTDLKATSGATAKWELKDIGAPTGPMTGIDYARGSNTGFFPIDVALTPASSGTTPPPPPPTSYSIKVVSQGNGTVSSSHTAATEGTVVTLTVVPEPGYALNHWQVISGGVTVSNGSTVFTFTMPAADVSLSALFQGLPPDEEYDPSKPIPGSPSGQPSEVELANSGISSDWLWIAIAVLAALVVGGGVVLTIVIIRKKPSAPTFPGDPISQMNPQPEPPIVFTDSSVQINPQPEPPGIAR